jgi:hypothetical protein
VLDLLEASDSSANARGEALAEAIEAQGQVSFASIVGLFCLYSKSLLPL